jgi:capsular polysaccharide biosynthesis protein/tetratricopeptide (TPR) repeat protein
MDDAAEIITAQEDPEARLRLEAAEAPADPGALWRLAKHLLGRGAEDEAVALVETAVALAPASAKLIARLVAVLVQRRDLIAADLWLSRLSDPDQQARRVQLQAWMRKEGKAQVKAAREHEARGRLEEAAAAWRQAVGLAPAELAWRLELCGFWLSLGRYEAALAWLEGAPDEPPVAQMRTLARALRARSPQRRSDGFTGPLWRAARRELMAGHAVLAEPALRELTLSHPHLAEPWAELRAARLVLGKAEAAEAARLEAEAAGGRPQAAMRMAAARPLSVRGLAFDLHDRFRLVPKDGALRRVSSPAELKSTADACLVVDPGGRRVEARPFVRIEDGRPGPPIAIETAESFVLALDNALVAGRGAVVTQQGQLIAEQFAPGKANKYHAAVQGDVAVFDRDFGREPLRVEYVDEEVFLCAGPTDLSYGDWLNQFPPRIWLAEAAELDCRILVNRDLPPNFVEMLERVGVDRSRLIFHKDGRASVYRRVYAPSWPFGLDNRPMADWLDIYRRAARPAAPAGRPLLYLTRRHVDHRPLVNEAEVAELFLGHGFREVVPERLTLEETLELFSSPACVAGPWGSAFQSVVFGAAPTAAVALMPPYDGHYMHSVGTFMHAAGCRFAHVTGQIVFADNPNASPWRIGMDDARRALDAALELSRA